MGLSGSTMGSYQCSVKRTGNSQPYSRKFLHLEKINEACFAVEEKSQWNDIHSKTYQYLFYFSGNSFILCTDFVTSGKRNFVEFEGSAERGKILLGLFFFV